MSVLTLTKGKHMNTLTNFRIDEDTRKSFHIWCIQNDTTIAENLRSHIDSVLDSKKTLSKKSTSWFSNGSTSESGLEGRWEDTYK